MTGFDGDSQLIVWTVFFFALYWAFCIFWGLKSGNRAKTASDFFVAGRSLPTWVFIMGATSASYAGWIFIAQPGLILRDGLSAGYLGFTAIVIPLGGIFFMKRQWMLSKRFGFLTSGELLESYYESTLPRLYTVLLALVFGIPFLGLLLGSAGFLFSIVTGGWFDRDTAMWLLAAVLVIYVTTGGIRAVSYVGTLHTLLIAAGMIILGVAALSLVGGFEQMNQQLALVASIPDAQLGTTLGRGGGDYNGWFSVAGVIQWTEGLDREMPVGGQWTSAMILSFLVAFLGVQMSPMFSIMTFSATSPKAFGMQQVWFGAAGAGLLLFVFAVLAGAAGHLLGGSGDVVAANQAIAVLLPDLGQERHAQLLAEFVILVSGVSPWLAAILLVCIISMVAAGTAAYLATSATVVTRDIFVRFFQPSANDRLQMMFSRVIMLILTVLGLLVASFAQDAMVALGALALSLSVQLLPSLVGVSWYAWITRQGVIAGLVIGALVVIATSGFGQYLSEGALPFGRAPWTIHAALWGLVANIVVCIVASVATRAEQGASTRQAFHEFLRSHSTVSGARRRLITTGWVVTIAWVFFAIGPGIVFGNWAFGEPSSGITEWDFSMPSIWAWQLIWWVIGVLLIWFLAYRMRLATSVERDIVPISDDYVRTNEYRDSR